MSDVDNPARDLAAEWNDPRASDITRREAARRAVNALPAIADLLDAMDVEPDSEIDHERAIADWWAAVDDARDAVAAALTGEES